MNFLSIALVTFLMIGTAIGVSAQTPGKQRLRTDPIMIGEIAPDFSLTDQNGDTVRLSSLAYPVVLVFYRGYW